MVSFKRKRQKRLAGTLQSKGGGKGSLENIRQIYQIWMAFILYCYYRIYYAKKIIYTQKYRQSESVYFLHT
jgi:hypothetical protein